MHPRTREKLVLTVVGWLAALVIFFPIFWMILTSFKTEVEAIATPPKFLFTPTLENYVTVRERADYVHFALNSIIISVGATLLATLIAVPAAYAMAFFPGKRTKDLLLWMLSTKMMPRWAS
jgi:sorbitol/mannitol transport system permease protein